jgi:DNA mismatch repair protein MutS
MVMPDQNQLTQIPTNLTPLMKQYWEVKSVHSDKIVFFRMGDFFELFYDDAKTVAPILGIALTQRNKKSDDHTPMCGMPHHSVANSINKLLALGFKIAICDQIEDPKQAQGIVKRAVTRILTPGIVYDPEVLDHGKPHYLAAIDEKSMSFCDFSTGESFFIYSDNLKHKISLLHKLDVVEILMTAHCAELSDEIKQKTITLVPDGKSTKSDHPATAQMILDYIKSLGDFSLAATLKPFIERKIESRLQILSSTLRHLEIFSNNRGEEKGTFWAAIDRTKTAAGRRLLREYLMFPLTDQAAIEARYDVIDLYRTNLFELKKSREILGSLGDMERRLSKLSLPQANARDLKSIAQSVQIAVEVLDLNSKIYKFQDFSHNELLKLSDQVQICIKDDAPLTIKQGQMFNLGYATELDELIRLSTDSASLIQELENKERLSTGISSLKIRYNNVFGYYIEITNTHKDKVPSSYLRKQTLANAERYCTEELIELEKKVLAAQTRRNELEYEIFCELKNKFIQMSWTLHRLSQVVSEIDVFTGLAWLSLEENFSRPSLSSGGRLYLVESRHPVVEQSLKANAQRFVANSIDLERYHCDLITGPNMAGKSTLMRQVALTVLLAQMGSFVPAAKAELPIYDSIFTRIGASDHLAEGLSTFMVEMKETAEMLNLAGENSLIILDEIGRGTATFDGLSLAQAILEYVLQQKFSHVFFATHYHELTSLSEKFLNFHNKHMKIQMNTKKDLAHMDFQYIYADGAAGQSYGVHVARLAGIPEVINQRAEALLDGYQQSATIAPEIEKTSNQKQLGGLQMDLFALGSNQFVEELKQLDINKLAPIDALMKLNEWKSRV